MVSMTEFDDLIEVLRDFVRREVMPAEAGIDESDEIPGRLIAQAKEMGLYGYALPAEFGGLGGGAHTSGEWFSPAGRDLGLKRILLTLLMLMRPAAGGTGE